MKFCELDASVEASEPHDFAVRLRAVRPQHIRVHRIPPRVRDDRERPSVGRDDSALLLFLSSRQEKLLKFRNCFSVGWVKRSDHMTGFATPFFHLSSWMRRQAQTPE